MQNKHSPPTPRATEASAVWYVNSDMPVIQPMLIPTPGENDILVEALVSAVSRGTESLVFQGKIPDSEKQRMRAPNQEGDFPYPVKYGYSMVGRVAAGPEDMLNKKVFCLYPHQSRFLVHREELTVLDDAVPAGRAVLAANMETALNAIWDGGAAPGDRIGIVGAGVVGCLTAYLASRIPGTQVQLIDINEKRRAIATALGVAFRTPSDAADDFDLVFHASASAAGLQTAIDCAATEARVVELSWYGSKPVTVGLGGPFHSKRLQLVASQVGMIPAARRSRWSFDRRLAVALSLLADDRLDSLFDESCDFHDAPRHLAKWLGPNGNGLCHRILYS